MEFKIESQRIYAIDNTGREVAEVTFPATNGVANINHTFVDASLRGQGVASELIRLAADKILEEGNKIKASCSYAVAWFKRHPEYNARY